MPFSADGFIASREEKVVAAALLESSGSVVLRIELGVVKAVDAVAVVVAAAASESVAGAGAGLVQVEVVAAGAAGSACGSVIGLFLIGALGAEK